MNRAIPALLLVLVTATPVVAAPRKVLVLPLDGTAPAETRKKLSASFQRLARVLDGDVQPGNTSLGDTAVAIGCDPAKPACIENVRATLGVDELVYGNADEAAGTVTVIVKRYRKGKPLRELTVSQAASEPPTKIEPQLLPVFGNDPLPVSGPAQADPAPVDPNPVVETAPQPQQVDALVPSSKRERNVWIGVTAGGGLLTAVGLALWAQAGNLQDDIDNADTTSNSDIADLRELEDKASSRAWAGNIFVVAGLAVAGYGIFRLFTLPDSTVTITPAATDGGAQVFVGARW